jgi:type II secretory pathway pseudopilin PulG
MLGNKDRAVMYDRRRGLTITGVTIAAAIVTLLAVIVIPQLLSSRMAVNQSAARANLKALSAALEAYAAKGQQGYPADISDLIKAKPPILNKNYIADSPLQGYNYDCITLDASGYSCSAWPEHCGRSGSKQYTVTTSGVFSERDCQSDD